jgi:hypothetical protein
MMISFLAGSQNWDFFGTSLCLKSKLKLLPELPNKQGLAWAKKVP